MRVRNKTSGDELKKPSPAFMKMAKKTLKDLEKQSDEDFMKRLKLMRGQQ